MKQRDHTPWDERAGSALNARRQLPKLAATYFSRVREILAKEPSPAKLHAARLATKRFRYTLELFRSRYGPGLETRLSSLRRVQQALGDVNDCVAARRLIRKSMAASPLRMRIERFLEDRTAAKVREFRRQWTEVFDAPGQEEWWTLYLARHARVRARRA